jgi:HTH-type transcriptional regulator/antitoxin HigA
MKAAVDFKSVPKTYTELFKMHMLRPIHDKVAYENAIEVLDAIAGHKLNAEQEDYFEALSSLVEVYERQHVPEPKTTGLNLLRHLIEANELTAADLSRMLGRDRSLGVRILNGERQLTIDHIKKLAEHFGVPAQTFIS